MRNIFIAYLLVPSIEMIYIGGMLSSSRISRKGFPL